MAVSSAIDVNAVARVVGIKTIFRNLRREEVTFLPQRVAVVGQGSSAAVYSSDKRTISTSQEAGEVYGFGSPIHLSAKQLLPVNGAGVGSIPVTVFPLLDAPTGVEAEGSITAVSAAASSGVIRIVINNIVSAPVSIAEDDTAANIAIAITQAVAATPDMPMTASTSSTVVTLTSKWKGASANSLKISVIGDDVGTTFTVTQPTGGLLNPDVQPALDNFGNVWETMVLNCLDIEDIVALDKYQVFGENRWGPLVKKPLVVFTANLGATVAAATVISDARKDEWINSQLVSPRSDDLPFVVAAAELAEIVVRANLNPPYDYGSLKAPGLVPGPDSVQWDYQERDEAVKKGSSTIEVRDGVVTLGDIVTFYHPLGDTVPAYRYVVDIVKLQNIIFNLDLIFNSEEWDGAPLLPNDQPTVNRAAKTPKAAEAAVASLTDALALQAIISDPEAAKESIIAEIDSINPKRLNLSVTYQLSGNSNVRSIDLNFGFFFGTQNVIS